MNPPTTYECGRRWKGRQVLITGNGGFIGTWLCLVLEWLGAKIYCWQKKAPSLFWQICGPKDVIILQDAAELLQALKFCETVIHLAGQSIVNIAFEDPATTIRGSVEGTLEILEALRESSSVETALFASSAVVYGQGQTAPFCEKSPLNANDPYGLSKVFEERLVGSYSASYFGKSGVCSGLVRCNTVFGGGDFKGRLIPTKVQEALLENSLSIERTTARKGFLFVLDCILGYLNLEYHLRALPIEETAFNFSGKDIRILDAVDQIAAQLNTRLEIKPQKNPSPGGACELSTLKAEQLLGWHPIYSFSDGLAATIEWFKVYHFGSPEELRALSRRMVSDYFQHYDRKFNVPQNN